MKIERITTGEWGKVRAFFDIRTEDGLIVKGFKLIEGNRGLFVGMPSQKDKEDKYQDTAYIPDQGVRDALLRMAKESSEQFGRTSNQPTAAPYTDEQPPLQDDDIPF